MSEIEENFKKQGIKLAVTSHSPSDTALVLHATPQVQWVTQHPISMPNTNLEFVMTMLMLVVGSAK